MEVLTMTWESKHTNREFRMILVNHLLNAEVVRLKARNVTEWTARIFVNGKPRPISTGEFSRQEEAQIFCEASMIRILRSILQQFGPIFDWSKAPRNAMFAGVDSDGRGWWYTEQPYWIAKIGRWECDGRCDVMREGDILKPYIVGVDSYEARPAEFYVHEESDAVATW
jgi:hypothetical protein